jgi:hypothetical protein
MVTRDARYYRPLFVLNHRRVGVIGLPGCVTICRRRALTPTSRERPSQAVVCTRNLVRIDLGLPENDNRA